MHFRGHVSACSDLDVELEWACYTTSDQPDPTLNVNPLWRDACGEKPVEAGCTTAAPEAEPEAEPADYTGMKLLRCYYRCSHPGCQVGLGWRCMHVG